MEGRTEGVHGNKKNRRLRTWRLDAAMDAITALTIKGVARATLRKGDRLQVSGNRIFKV